MSRTKSSPAPSNKRSNSFSCPTISSSPKTVQRKSKSVSTDSTAESVAQLEPLVRSQTAKRKSIRPPVSSRRNGSSDKLTDSPIGTKNLRQRSKERSIRQSIGRSQSLQPSLTSSPQQTAQRSTRIDFKSKVQTPASQTSSSPISMCTSIPTSPVAPPVSIHPSSGTADSTTPACVIESASQEVSQNRRLSLNVSSLRATLDAFQLDSSRSQDTLRTEGAKQSPPRTSQQRESNLKMFPNPDSDDVKPSIVQGEHCDIRHVEGEHHDGHWTAQLESWMDKKIETMREEIRVGMDRIREEIREERDEEKVRMEHWGAEYGSKLERQLIEALNRNLGVGCSKPVGDKLNEMTNGIAITSEHISADEQDETAEFYGEVSDNRMGLLSAVSTLDAKVDRLLGLILHHKDTTLPSDSVRTRTPPRDRHYISRPNRSVYGRHRPRGTPVKQSDTPCSWALTDSMALSESRMTLGISTMSLRNDPSTGGREIDYPRMCSRSQLNSSTTALDVHGPTQHNAPPTAGMFNETRFQTLLSYGSQYGSNEYGTQRNGEHTTPRKADRLSEQRSPQSAPHLRNEGGDLCRLDRSSDFSLLEYSIGEFSERREFRSDGLLQRSNNMGSELEYSGLRTIMEVDSSQDSDASVLYNGRKWELNSEARLQSDTRLIDSLDGSMMIPVPIP